MFSPCASLAPVSKGSLAIPCKLDTKCSSWLEALGKLGEAKGPDMNGCCKAEFLIEMLSVRSMFALIVSSVLMQKNKLYSR